MFGADVGASSYWCMAASGRAAAPVPLPLTRLPIPVALHHPHVPPQVREVARHYGFKHTVTTNQLTRAMPAAVPFQ